jgi:thiol-disulfide isomerase/thioredoxin
MMKEKILEFLKEDGLTVGVILALIIGYFILRTPGDAFDSLAELETALVTGRPTVVQFYANNCSICLTSKPRVDQLERDIADQADMLRLNVRGAPGDQLAYRWQVSGLPTFFVLDGAGEIVYRQSGAPKTEEIKAAVIALSASGN